MITITIQNTLAQLSNINDLKLIDAISKQLSYQKKSFEFQKFLHMRTGWDGIYRLLNRKLQFPSGLVDKVCSFLGDHGIPYQVEDQRVWNHNKPLKWKGHNLYPYQEKLVDVCLDKKFGIVKACTGSGKAQPLDAKILTIDGWKTMGELTMDDKVISASGKAANIVGIFPQGEKDVYRITMSDGSSTECCGDHLWETQSANERRKRNYGTSRRSEGQKHRHKPYSSVRTTFEILKTLQAYHGKVDKRKNHQIPTTKAIQFVKKELLIDPYLMGCLIGDGSFRAGISFSSCDQEILDRVLPVLDTMECNFAYSGGYSYRIRKKTGRYNHKNKLISAIKNYGLMNKMSYEKSIPSDYLFSSVDDRINLLNGLMDTDGTLSKNGCNFSYCTTSEQLSKDVKFLTQSLGGVAKIKTKKTTYTYNGIKKKGRLAYNVSISLPNEINPFWLPRKRNKVVLKTKYPPKRYIADVIFVGKKECQCIAIDDPSHLYLTDECIVTHNTTVISKVVSELNVQTVIYVVSIDLLEQMRETLTRSLSVPIGMVGGGECDIQNITVCSAWTPGKLFSKTKVVSDEEMKQDKWKPSDEQKKQIIEMVRSAKLVILDETQFAAAETIKTILNNSLSASYRFGLSGTPWRSDGDDLLLEASFGPTIYDLPSSTLIEQGYLVPPMILFRDIPPMDLDYRLSYPEVKSEYIIENKRRNEILIKSLVGLLDIGRKPLVLFKEHKHGEILANMIPSNVKFHVVTGKLKKDERTKIRKQFQDGDIELILASTVYDQGVDLPALDALVLAGGGRSTAKALQRVGRVIRGHPGKKNAWVIDCFDDAPYLSKHSSERYNIFKSEKLFKIRTEPAFTRYLEQSIITK